MDSRRRSRTLSRVFRRDKGATGKLVKSTSFPGSNKSLKTTGSQDSKSMDGSVPNVMVNGIAVTSTPEKKRINESLTMTSGATTAIKSSSSSSPQKPSKTVTATAKHLSVDRNDDNTFFSEQDSSMETLEDGVNKRNIKPNLNGEADSVSSDVNKETAEDNTTIDQAETSQTGIFSRLLSSFNLKSVTDLTDLTRNDTSLTKIDSVTSHGSNLLSSPTNQSIASGTSAANMVTFKPVKKSLIQSLNNGGELTLDEFPDPSNSPSIRNNSPSRQQPLNSPILKPYSHNLLEDLESRRNSSTSSLSQVNSSGGDSQQQGQGQPIFRRSKSFKRKLSRKSTSSPPPPVSFDKKVKIYSKMLNIHIPSNKRQKSFHSLFQEIPANEIYLMECTCALRKDILIQGKIYLTEKNICFHSNIIGLTTHLTIPFNKIYKIQKSKTIGIPNAIQFSNLHEKFTFASFISRDVTYDTISQIWRLNGHNQDGDELVLGLDEADMGSDDDLNSGDQEDEEEEDDEEDEDSHYDSDITDASSVDARNRLSKDLSATDAANTPTGGNVPIGESESDEDSDADDSTDGENMVKDGEDESAPIDNNDDNKFYGLPLNGPKTHKETTIPYTKESGDEIIIQDTFNAPLSIVFDLLFGNEPSSQTFYKDIIAKQGNVKIDPIPKFANNFRKFQYIKPLNAPVGPKETRCLVEETIEKKDFGNYCLITQLTASPDVPSGNSFKVKTKIWIHWSSNNNTKIFVITNVNWSGKSWIKGVIEKNTYSGQKEALGVLSKEVKSKLTSIKSGQPMNKPSSGANAANGAKKKRKKTITEVVEEVEEPIAEANSSIVDIIMNMMDLKLGLIIILIIWLLVLSFRSSPSIQGDIIYTKDRMGKSGAELWDWIEKRERSIDFNDNNKSQNQLASNEVLNIGDNAKSAVDYQKKLKLQDLKYHIDFEEKKLELLKKLLND